MVLDTIVLVVVWFVYRAEEPDTFSGLMLLDLDTLHANNAVDNSIRQQ